MPAALHSFKRRKLSGECAVDEILKPLLLDHRACLAGLDFAPVENHQRRHGLNGVLRRDAGASVDIHLHDFDFALHVGRYRVERRCHGLARPAPLGIKIHHDGFGRLQHDFVEGAVGNDGGLGAHVHLSVGAGRAGALPALFGCKT